MQGKIEVRNQAPWKVLLSFAVVVVLTPVTLWLFVTYGNRQYYLVSVILIVYTMIPFFTAFESKKPQARELAIIAVMCALCVAARAAFIWLPQFKPMAALVMLAGIAFGAQAGFLTGTISVFVSNFFFGQGPWTPWQMFAFGFAGFLAGFLADRGIIPRSKMGKLTLIVISVCAGIFVIVVMGPILDTSTLLTMMTVINLQTAMAVYLSGLPFNVMQAIATVITLLLVANPLLDKFERVRVKYGLLQ